VQHCVWHRLPTLSQISALQVSKSQSERACNGKSHGTSETLFKILRLCRTWRYLKSYSMRLCTVTRLETLWDLGPFKSWRVFHNNFPSHSTLSYASAFEIWKSGDICKYTEARGIWAFAQRRRWLAPRALTLVRYLATLESEWVTLDIAILICQIRMKKSTLWIVSLLFRPCSEIYIDQHVQF